MAVKHCPDGKIVPKIVASCLNLAAEGITHNQIFDSRVFFFCTANGPWTQVTTDYPSRIFLKMLKIFSVKSYFMGPVRSSPFPAQNQIIKLLLRRLGQFCTRLPPGVWKVAWSAIEIVFLFKEQGNIIMKWTQDI